MAYTFAECWRQVILHAPLVDPMLARSWTQWAYNQFCDRRGWSHLRADTTFSIAVQKTGTCTVAIGSATVNGGTLLFAATDVGRQFRLGTIPIYTIIAVSVAGGTSCTLDRAYTEASGSVTAYILDAYVTVPENFQRFISVLDSSQQWRVRFWVSQDLLNRWDPVRQSTGQPRMLVSQGLSPVVADAGRSRFELYPYQTGAQTYPVAYYKKGDDLADTDTIVGPLSRRSQEILMEGALSRCAMWPGLDGRRNPYFSLQLAEAHRKAFEDKIIEVTVKDDELYFESMPAVEYPWADYPWDSNWLQSHEPNTID